MLNNHTIERKYFTMEEAALLLNVSQPEIRDWDERFKLKLHRNNRGDRKPSTDDLNRLGALIGLKRYFRNEGIDMITRDFERIKDKGLDGIFLPKIMRLCQKK